jgi:hypothetical protein
LEWNRLRRPDLPLKLRRHRSRHHACAWSQSGPRTPGTGRAGSGIGRSNLAACSRELRLRVTCILKTWEYRHSPQFPVGRDVRKPACGPLGRPCSSTARRDRRPCEHDRCTVAPFAARLSTVVILKCHRVFCKNRLGFDAHNPAEENDRGRATTNINTRPLN